MNKPCGNSHPIFNPGGLQQQRAGERLAPETVPYDERTVSDWLVYLSKYARHINYFALTDELAPSDTWEKFFTNDVSILLARIAEEQVAELQKEINDLLRSPQHDTLTDAQAKASFTVLLGHVFNLVYRLNGYFANLQVTLAVREEINNRILTHFEARLKRLIAYYKAALLPTHDLIDATADNSLPNGYMPSATLPEWDLNTVWFAQSAATNWAEYYNSISADEGPYLANVLPATTPRAKINLAARYQLLTESIKGLLSGFAAIIKVARNEFDRTITQWPEHWPDKALLISFLKLLELYRQEINTLTGRHLDHYFKEVLQLNLRQPNPDTVFLTGELVKGKEEALLAKGTNFLGGKDESGTERIYSTNKDYVLNDAKVSEQKAILRLNNTVHAAQNVATIDGLEKELEFPDQGYSAFGTTAMPAAELGFAVASDHLFMEDGVRNITIELTGTGAKSFTTSRLNTIKNRLKARVTGEKGWIYLTNISLSWRSASDVLQLSGTVAADAGPVVAAQPDVHERNFYPALPVIEVLIDPRDHDDLQQFDLASVALTIVVNGCRHPQVVTVQGVVDTSKAFQAFGPIPERNSSVIIGAHEMLRKNLISFTVSPIWADVDDTAERTSGLTASTLQLEQLKGNTWSPLSGSVTSTNALNFSGVSKQTGPKEPFQKNSTQGFIRFTLNSNLNHKKYPNELATVMARIAATGTDEPIPLPYQPPTINSLSVTYSAKTSALNLAKSSSYQTNNTVFYHLTPFGGYEASGNMLDVSNPPLVMALPNEGEYYLALENLEGGESVNILIDVLEGSANPLKAKQTVTWQFLWNNRWHDFESGTLEDGTEGLIKTGLLKIALPFYYENSGSFFSNNKVWIRATIAQHTDATCRVIGVYAQGMAAELISQGHADSHYEIPLSAETVSKLQKANGAIKKITQPAAAVGGRPLESDSKFYVRVSERLRHKDRSVSMWDYERLVLEEFAQLSLVKSLSHTRYHVDEVTNALNYSESAPGNVAIVCVPQKPSEFDAALKPYTPIDVLEDVKHYLALHLPSWATLHVRNPLFEEVQIDCRVQFLPEITDVDFYLEQLNQEVKDYLSPWKANQGNALRFNWRIHKSMIIDFLDERPYVDYVRDVKLNVIYGPTSAERELDVNEARPRFAISVLTSAANHVILPV